MKGILINAEARTITEVEVPVGYKNIYPFLGAGVDMFQCVDINRKGDTIYVDEEGLLKGPTVFFLYAGYNQPLAGNGLVLGTDEKGETVSTTETLETIKKNVTFMDGFEVRLWAKRQGL